MRIHNATVYVFSQFAIIALATLALFAVTSTTAFAQSGSRSSGSSNRQVQPPANVGLQGYCPVCILDLKQWTAGNASFASTFDGRTYLFPGREQKQTFDANPAKYVPVLAGDCVVALQTTGRRVPGNVRAGAFHNGRLYLFANGANRETFRTNPEQFANADLAVGGKCVVCQMDMQQDMDGKPEFAVMYNGMRYFFPGMEQRDKFIANPARYAVNAAPGDGSQSRGSESRGSSSR